VLDEPTTGLHLSDVAKLMKQLDGFIEADNSVIVVEHNMSRRRGKRLDHRHWAGVGDEGGRIVVLGPPQKVARIVEPDIQVPCRSPAWRRGVSATDVPRRSDVPKAKLQRGR
jgi:excinuclease UvrABC ATPase subunit